MMTRFINVEEFEQTVARHLTGIVRTDAYRKTDTMDRPFLLLDVFA
ncbi:MAG: hypothetical protein HY891_06465 [Deltaproteobacteria bacterium]|nr:hypothetical protein [Deltaproteobacteria bacterium]